MESFSLLHCLYGGQVFWGHHSAVFTAVTCDAVVGRAPWVPSEDLQVPVLERGVGQLVRVVIEDSRPVLRRAVPFVLHLRSTHRLVWFPLCCFLAVLAGELFQLPLSAGFLMCQPQPLCKVPNSALFLASVPLRLGTKCPNPENHPADPWNLLLWIAWG